MQVGGKVICSQLNNPCGDGSRVTSMLVLTQYLFIRRCTDWVKETLWSVDMMD